MSLEKILICTHCGMDAPRGDANYCYCCGKDLRYSELLATVPDEFKVSPETNEKAIKDTLAEFKNK